MVPMRFRPSGWRVGFPEPAVPNVYKGECVGPQPRIRERVVSSAEKRGLGGVPAAAVRWLVQPLCPWSSHVRWLAIPLAVVMGVGWTLVQVQLPTVFHSPDSSHYLKIAAGHTELVEQPFASRQLGPLVAAAMGRLFGGDLHKGFLVQAFLSLAFAMGVTCWLAARSAAPRWMLLALVLVPSWGVLVQYLVLPDLWYAAMLAALLVMLEEQWYWAAALWMLPMMLSRESTSLTMVCFLVAAWPRLRAQRRWLVAGVAVVAAGLGSVMVAKLAAASQPNAEHLPQAVYMLAKLPWNFLRNVLGIVPWSDANMDLCKVPVWSVPFRFGPVHALGVCGFSFSQQLQAAEGILMNFGLLPLLVAVAWWQQRRRDGRSVLLRFTLLYGGLSFVLAPLLGAGFVHLMQYAWPLFLVALPRLFDERAPVRLSGRQVWASVGFFGLSLGVPLIARCPYLLPRLALGVAIWLVGYGLLQVWLDTGAEVAEFAPV